MDEDESPNDRESAIRYAWLTYFVSFPAGFIPASLMTAGQDAAGQGMIVGLGLMLGIFVGAIAACVITYRTACDDKKMLWVLRLLPWGVLIAYFLFLTSDLGDRFL